MTKIGAPAAVALMALGLGLAASPDLPVRETPRAVAAIVAGLTLVFVATLLDRRAPRRLVAVGVATLAAALAYDALRAEYGSMTLAAGQGTASFERREAGGGVSSRPLGNTVVLEGIEPGGTVVMAQTGTQHRVRVSAWRAGTVSGYRVSQPRPTLAVPGPVVSLSVSREPAALLAALGVLIAAIGVAWSRW
jgi:hypothetical protein